MTSETIVRVLALCVVLAGVETLHGITRTVLVVPRIGKDRALKLSAATGSLLALLACYVLVPPIGLRGGPAHLLVGLVLALFMAAFDLAIGRLVMRKSWSRLWPDFNPAGGNYLSFGLLFLVLAPLLAGWLRTGGW